MGYSTEVQTVQYTVYSVQCTVYSVQYTVYSVQCTALYRVREFLSYVVPSNTLSSEEFRLRCIDVMAGSVRRTDEAS